MKKVSIVLAGGKGERFWPLSRENYPKQFLKIYDDKPMLVHSIERLKKIFEDIYIVSNELLMDKIKKIINISDKQAMIEPKRKNTAPCLIYSLSFLERMYGENTVVFVGPTDHYIGKLEFFFKAVNFGMNMAEKFDCLITFGIEPTRVETGYGYIQKGEKITSSDGNLLYKVKKFKEKPDFETAKKYYTDSRYLWNSGIFTWTIKTFKNELKKHAYSFYEWYEFLLSSKNDSEFHRRTYEFFQKIQPISIDYALLEKSDNVYVVESYFTWDDLGSWTALERIIPPDENSNVVRGKIFMRDSYDNIVYSESKPIALFGVENMIVVETPDLTFICPKSKIHKLKEYINSMKNNPEFNKYV